MINEQDTKSLPRLLCRLLIIYIPQVKCTPQNILTLHNTCAVSRTNLLCCCMCCVTMEGGRGCAELIGSAGFGTSAIAQERPSTLNNVCAMYMLWFIHTHMHACTYL